MAERRVLLEVRLAPDAPAEAAVRLARNWLQYGFEVDPDYRAVPLGASGGAAHTTVIIRGLLREGAREAALLSAPQVAGMWEDAPIRPTGLV